MQNARSRTCWRERCHLIGAAELATNSAFLRARIAQLWQTRILRFSKLNVGEEIENVLTYYRTTFLREIPRLYAALEEQLGGGVAPFFRMGNWIGGDRDGNPNVNADTLVVAFLRQSETALRHYLAEVHELGAELSISRALVECSPELQAWRTNQRTKDPTARMSPIGARSSESTPASLPRSKY